MDSLIESYRERCRAESLEENILQLDLLKELSKFKKESELNLIQKFLVLITKTPYKKCFYIHGTVGVGKTLIMDLFFSNIKESRKKRIHFHEFMIDTHDSLHNIRKNNSKIKDNSFLIRTYAKSLKKDFDLIFFDEFQVTNIADAMILGQLFIELFDLNIKIVLTSNDKPKDLYKDGLQRELFLPFIILIESNSNIFNLNLKKDYRISGIDRDEIFFSPISNENYKTINELYKNLIDGHEPKDIKIEIKKRSFEIKKFANNVARFNFNELCGQPLGSEDYLKLIQNIKTLFLENVPAFSDDNVDKQERFITLIDILYDNEVKLIMSADKSLENFTSSRRLDLKFKRTCSRLSEMKSQDYWRNNQ